MDPREASHNGHFAHVQSIDGNKLPEVDKDTEIHNWVSVPVKEGEYVGMTFYSGIVLDLQKSYRDNTEFTYTANNSVRFFYTDI